MKVSDIIQEIENLASPLFQESYDNSGLLAGSSEMEVTTALISLDMTEEVIDEAIAKGCNLIIAHHPVIFRGLKRLNGKNHVERTLIKAIKADIALYAVHTNLDNVKGGVNFKIAERLGLKDLQILAPKKDTLLSLTIYVPRTHVEALKDALHSAGAGKIGQYTDCSFETVGTGQFRPIGNASPFVGEVGKLEKVEEVKIELLVPIHRQKDIIKAMYQSHPYEEVSYFLHPLQNPNPEVGSGVVGYLESPMEKFDFLKLLKEKMQLSVIRYTQSDKKSVHKIAVCGGAGSFILPNALTVSADVLVTADFKYHDFFDSDNQISIADIGHYESEQFTKELIFEHLSKKIPTFASHLSEVNTNPIAYFY